MKIIIKLLGILLPLALVTGCAEKYELDRKMEELCKKDGGVKIYETVKLPPEMFDESGLIKKGGFKKIKEFEYITIIAEKYEMLSSTTILKNGDPLKGEGRLSRSYTKIMRISDKKVIAELIDYSRSGGDLWYPGMPSQKNCNLEAGNFIHEIFIKG